MPKKAAPDESEGENAKLKYLMIVGNQLAMRESLEKLGPLIEEDLQQNIVSPFLALVYEILGESDSFLMHGGAPKFLTAIEGKIARKLANREKLSNPMGPPRAGAKNQLKMLRWAILLEFIKETKDIPGFWKVRPEGNLKAKLYKFVKAWHENKKSEPPSESELENWIENVRPLIKRLQPLTYQDYNLFHVPVSAMLHHFREVPDAYYEGRGPL